MLMRYCARATDSLFPVMVIIRSKFAGASRSSELEILIMAPDNCLHIDHPLEGRTNQEGAKITWSQPLLSRPSRWYSLSAHWVWSSRASAGTGGPWPGLPAWTVLDREIMSVRSPAGFIVSTWWSENAISEHVWPIHGIKWHSDSAKLKSNKQNIRVQIDNYWPEIIQASSKNQDLLWYSR